MKKILAIFVVFLMLFSIVACSEGTNDSQETGAEQGDVDSVEAEGEEKTEESEDNESAAEEEAETSAEETETEGEAESDSEATLGTTFKTGPYDVTVNSVRQITDYDGNPAIVINYNWTNNSEETTSWMGSMMTQVFQDGVELEVALVMDGMDSEKSMKEIRPGASLEGIEEAFVTTSENPLEIEVSALEEMFTGEPVLVQVDFPEE